MTTAIITGGSRGLGRALAAELANDGWTVIIDGRDIDAVLVTAAQLRGTVIPVPGDITDAAHRSNLLAAAGRVGGLDLLVNNASTLEIGKHTSELQSQSNLVCRLLLEKKKKTTINQHKP